MSLTAEFMDFGEPEDDEGTDKKKSKEPQSKAHPTDQEAYSLVVAAMLRQVTESFKKAAEAHTTRAQETIDLAWYQLVDFLFETQIPFDSAVVPGYTGECMIPLIDERINSIAADGKVAVRPVFLLILVPGKEIVFYSRATKKEVAHFDAEQLDLYLKGFNATQIKLIIAELLVKQFVEQDAVDFKYRSTGYVLSEDTEEFLRSVVKD